MFISYQFFFGHLLALDYFRIFFQLQTFFTIFLLYPPYTQLKCLECQIEKQEKYVSFFIPNGSKSVKSFLANIWFKVPRFFYSNHICQLFVVSFTKKLTNNKMQVKISLKLDIFLFFFSLFIGKHFTLQQQNFLMQFFNKTLKKMTSDT